MFLPFHIHTSASPFEHRKILHASLESLAIHPRLHYETPEQTRKWLALHQKYAPIANQDVQQIYEQACKAAVRSQTHTHVDVISLGCGGGNKDIPLLRQLHQAGRIIRYAPHDISLGLVFEATLQVQRLLPDVARVPSVGDLEHAGDLARWLERTLSPPAPRIFLFFGMLPSLSPRAAQSCLLSLLKVDDFLLAGVNLSPGNDYDEGLRKVLPQYDNIETRDWLLTLVRDLGIPQEAGTLRFEILPSPGQPRLHRIAALYQFQRETQIILDAKTYRFAAGTTWTLFDSNRHTPELARDFLRDIGIPAPSLWIAPRGEEAVLGGRKEIAIPLASSLF